MSRAEGLKVGIVASDPKEWHVERLTSELKSRSAEAYVLSATRFRSGVGLEPKLSVRGYPIDDYDAVIVRKVPGGTAERVLTPPTPSRSQWTNTTPLPASKTSVSKLPGPW
jgi:hypothetical protein